jgi:hypothetical protein
MESFWKIVHKRALKETCDALKLTREQIVLTALKYGAFVLVGFAFFAMTLTDLWSAIQNSLIMAIVIPIVCFLPVYVFKYLPLPTKMWNESEERIRTLSEGRPSLKLAYGKAKTSDRGNHKMTYVNAISEGAGDVMGARVLINEVMFRTSGSDRWVPTTINTRHIMSWTNVPDDPNRRGEKYGPRQLSQGDNTVDFITCPAINDQGGIYLDGQGRRAFLFRIDPDHAQVVSNVFSEHGTYRFVFQLSAPNVLDPPRLTLLVEWDGQTATIRSEDGQVLETV